MSTLFKEKPSFKDTCYSYEAKTANICNSWTFWPVIQRVYCLGFCGSITLLIAFGYWPFLRFELKGWYSPEQGKFVSESSSQSFFGDTIDEYVNP